MEINLEQGQNLTVITPNGVCTFVWAEELLTIGVQPSDDSAITMDSAKSIFNPEHQVVFVAIRRSDVEEGDRNG